MCHAFPCTFCEKVCTTSSELDVHILLLHENELTAAGYQRDSQTENAEVLRDCSYIKCDQCDFSTRLRRAMKTHIQKQHATQPQLVCTLCKYSAISIHDEHLLSQHVRTNLQINLNNFDCFRCEHCGLLETNQENLSKHVVEAHQSPVLHECEFCPFKCKRHIELK